MTTVTTTRPINLAQLAAEIGTTEAPAPLTMVDDGETRAITSLDESVDEAALQAAVDAHEPTPPPPSVESLMQAQLDELTDLTFELLTLLEGM